MPFKVKCRLIEFTGDEEHFPCRFGYKIGDEFIYDGEKFVGRVCAGLLVNAASVIKTMHEMGNKQGENALPKYSGLVIRDPSKKKYDGIGWTPVRQFPKGTDKRYISGSPLPPEKRQGGWPIVCNDSRTSALFIAQIDGLSNSGWDKPYFHRQMNILKKIKEEPGITTKGILKKFSQWERDEIFPPLTLLMLEMLVDELAQVGSIKIMRNKVYPADTNFHSI